MLSFTHFLKPTLIFIVVTRGKNPNARRGRGTADLLRGAADLQQIRKSAANKNNIFLNFLQKLQNVLDSMLND